jgi:hypothetical protein
MWVYLSIHKYSTLPMIIKTHWHTDTQIHPYKIFTEVKSRSADYSHHITIAGRMLQIILHSPYFTSPVIYSHVICIHLGVIYLHFAAKWISITSLDIQSSLSAVSSAVKTCTCGMYSLTCPPTLSFFFSRSSDVELISCGCGALKFEVRSISNATAFLSIVCLHSILLTRSFFHWPS